MRLFYKNKILAQLPFSVWTQSFKHQNIYLIRCIILKLHFKKTFRNQETQNISFLEQQN